MADGVAANAARKAEGNEPLRFLARAGFVANGLLHGVIGVIAISVALRGGGGEADQSGALRQLAAAPGGAVLLWMIVIGMVALGLWQILQIFVVVGPDPKRKWAHRLGEFGKAVAYFAVAAIAFITTVGVLGFIAKGPIAVRGRASPDCPDLERARMAALETECRKLFAVSNSPSQRTESNDDLRATVTHHRVSHRRHGQLGPRHAARVPVPG